METMLFSEISINSDGCCLVCHDDTVYKVKVIFGQEVRKCDSMEFHLELEQVFRAVLHLAQSDKPIPPIFTNHLMVKPLKKDWAICHKIGFQQNGKDLQTSRYYFQFHVSERPVWKTTQDKVLSGKKPIFTKNHETTGKQTRKKPTRNNERDDSEFPDRESEDREFETNSRQPKNRELEKQQTSSRQLHNGVGYSGHGNLDKGHTHCRKTDNRELQRRELQKRNCYAREQENKETVSKGKNRTASSDSEDDQLESRRCLRRSARISDISSKEIDSTGRRSMRKRVERSAVIELSQSGVTDLDITGGTESGPTNQEDNWRQKRKSSNLNVDDITGFSYKVNKFRSKIYGRDDQLGKNNRHVLYRAGGCGHGTERPPLIMELPEVSPSDGTAEIPNKSKRKRPSDTDQTLTKDQTNSSTERCGGLTASIPNNKPTYDNVQTTVNPRRNQDGSSDSRQSGTDSQSLRDGRRKQNTSQSNGHKRLLGSSIKVQRSSDSPKGHRAHTRSSEPPKGRKSASPAKDVKIFTRSLTSSKGHRSQARSVTPSKGHRGRLRSATPSKSLRGQLRSATPSSHRNGMRSATTSIARRGRMRSATPSEGHRIRLRSAISSKAQSDHLRPATLSKSLRGRKRLATPSEESERLLNMTHPEEHGIQVNDVDRYLVEQEELQEMSKLQKMASTHEKQNGYQTRGRKRSGLWNFVDSMIITPAKKMFKRI
ncbi:uncharacterized protein LOC110445125 isoform X2 [Mizuhopecten yessoensis]|uniref:Uncharacterized protein n=1 Tax=Mizuhopecten yessoensis TaxID=6573 RepID=A0A210R0D6_MIZYE|nr:uncharacterized protein LOC110445125 isoform X2 [Mizuhopecten yessoensis]OWF54457.1 hypothetical protein KP79_PYT21620 [Mizuhopecten yessoensis]